MELLHLPIPMPPPPAPRDEEAALPFAGPAALGDEELLALVLSSRARGAARRLLERAGTLRRLATLALPEIGAIHGLDVRDAARVAAAIELGRRTAYERLPRGAVLTAPGDVWRHFRPRLRDERRELFLVALLDVKNRLLREVRISEGSLSASLVHPREAFGAAVREPAHAVIFVHNHPSGDPEPSDEDAALTKRLVQAGDVLGIRVLDHVIAGEESWYSFADAGRLR